METKFTKLMKEGNLDSEAEYWIDIFYFGFKYLFRQKLIDNKYPCPKCSEPMKFTGFMLESYPPQFEYRCGKCGKIIPIDSASHEILEEFRLLDSEIHKESEGDKKGK